MSATGTGRQDCPEEYDAVFCDAIEAFPWAGTVEVRSDGSVWRIQAHGQPCAPRRIDLPDKSRGYRNVVLPDADNRWRTYKAHRVVWEWHHGPIPPGLQIDHLNGVKDDNRIENLDLVSQSENLRRARANGCRLAWSDATHWRGRPRVTDDQKLQAATMRQAGETWKSIATELGISVSHAQRIAQEGTLFEAEAA